MNMLFWIGFYTGVTGLFLFNEVLSLLLSVCSPFFIMNVSLELDKSPEDWLNVNFEGFNPELYIAGLFEKQLHSIGSSSFIKLFG